jgi:hypothetical protein
VYAAAAKGFVLSAQTASPRQQVFGVRAHVVDTSAEVSLPLSTRVATSAKPLLILFIFFIVFILLKSCFKDDLIIN